MIFLFLFVGSVARADDSVNRITGILDRFELLPMRSSYQGNADTHVPEITIDSAAGIEENVFYPFGGVDVITAANSPMVKKIVVAQLEPFGFVDEGIAAFEQAEFHDEVAHLTEVLFDSIVEGWIESDTLAYASELTDGIGVHALMVIRRLMHAKIKSIGYLQFENGAWKELPFDQPPREPDHGFIEFEYLGRTVKYYLLRADLKDDSKSKLRPADMALLFNEKPYDSILRHIHGAQQKLKKQFTQLVDVLQKSERIFSTGEEEEPFSTFPKFEVMYDQPKRLTVHSPFFGMRGEFTILQRKPRDPTDAVTARLIDAWEASGKPALHVGELTHHDANAIARLTQIIRHMWREIDFLALEADASQQDKINSYIGGEDDLTPKFMGPAVRDYRLLLFLREINKLRIDHRLPPIKVIALDPSDEGYADYNSWFHDRPAYMYRRLIEQTDSLKQKGIIFTGAAQAARGTVRLPRLLRWMLKVESSFTPLGDAIQSQAFSVFLKTDQTWIEKAIEITSKSSRNLQKTFDFICERELVMRSKNDKP